MDDKIGLTSNLDEDTTIDNFDSEMVLLYGMELNVEEPIVAIGIEDKGGHPKESEMVYRDEEENENYMEEVAGEDDPEEEVNIEEDPEEEVRNDENPKEEENLEENNDEDPEEEMRNDENTKEEVNIEENKEEDLEDEVKNDENPKEEVTIEENDEKYPGEDARNDVRNEGKLEAISKKKVSKLRKRPQMLKKKKTALRTMVKNVHISTSKMDEDTKMISLPTIDENNTPNDVGAREVACEKNDIFDDIDGGVALSNQVKMNVVVRGDEIGEASNEENTREELQNEGDTRREAKAKEKLEGNSKKKANKWRKIDRKKKKALGVKNEVVVKNGENSESSKKQVTIKQKCTGMIFMCSSKTKKDCYHYQVLGLPASKRDIVFEIYEGMKLFLFDFDLKLMYGIFEAAGPGGYNIEPKAFKSAFPSQVRFSVLEDCLPLAEEKFKKTIKDNYYSKNKFECQLNSTQVEDLCELFRVASKGSTFKQLHGSYRAEASTLLVDYGPKQPPRGSKAKKPRKGAPTFVDRMSKRPRRCMKAESQQAEAPRPVDCEPKRPSKKRKAESLQAKAPSSVDREPKRPHKNRKAESPRAASHTIVYRKSKQPRRSRKAETRPFVDHKPKRLRRRSPRAEIQNFLYGDGRHHGWEDERHRTLARDHLYLEDPVAYRMEVYESPLEHQPLHRPLASSLPCLERDVYWRDQVQYHDHDPRPLDVELRRRDEFEHHDSYTIPRYQDDFDRRGSYLASRGYSSYHDPSSSAAQPSKHYTPASRTPASTYHLSAAPPPDYQHHRAAYGYYP